MVALSQTREAPSEDVGAHTYERLDKPGTFHTDWIRERKLKKWSRAKKEAFIRGDFVALRQLATRRSPHPKADGDIDEAGPQTG